MDYRFDIFVSYRRSSETQVWLDRHFLPLLELHVRDELGRDLKVYWDKSIEAGTSWTTELAHALGDSRILMPLWSGSYLSSDWCSIELGGMLDRQRETGCCCHDHPHCLVIPAVIHNAPFPGELAGIQKFDIIGGYNVRMAYDSPGAQMLETVIRGRAAGIARCIENAPPWNAEWSRTAAETFKKRLSAVPVQRVVSVPRFTP